RQGSTWAIRSTRRLSAVARRVLRSEFSAVAAAGRQKRGRRSLAGGASAYAAHPCMRSVSVSAGSIVSLGPFGFDDVGWTAEEQRECYRLEPHVVTFVSGRGRQPTRKIRVRI